MSLSNAQLKFLQSLKLKKFRQKFNNYFVEGPKMVEELLFNDVESVKGLYGLPSYLNNLPKHLRNQIECIEITEKDLKKISLLSTPNQVMAVAALPDLKKMPDLSGQRLSIYLDRIQDPGNLGTIIRIADWFGVKHVLCAPGTVDAYSAKVVQASMGAIFRVGVSYVDFADLVNKQPELHYMAAVLDNGDSIYDASSSKDSVLIIGNESKGIEDAVLANTDQLLSIPRLGNNGAESLNAGVACGIICGQLLKPNS